MDDNRWEYLVSAQGEILAQIFESLLNAHDIPTLLSGEAVAKIYGLTANELAVVDILVPTEHISAARQILQDYQSGELERTDFEADAIQDETDQPPGDPSAFTSD